jgi:hypothetical protein
MTFMKVFQPYTSYMNAFLEHLTEEVDIHTTILAACPILPANDTRDNAADARHSVHLHSGAQHIIFSCAIAWLFTIRYVKRF